MTRFTDPNYFLPTITALVPFRRFNSGKTKPMLLQGICSKTLEKSDYVVKFTNGPEMTIRSACSELIASFIAMELDLNVPEPAIINITADFVSTLVGEYDHSDAQKSIGNNFGSRYILDLLPIADQTLNSKMLYQAKQIFPFDIFVSNLDRRIEKPNMHLINDDEILLLDHELAFSFLRYLFPSTQPWILNNPNDRKWIEGHYFFPKLKPITEQAFDSFVEKLDRLNNTFWDKVRHVIPDDWTSEDLHKIQNTLSLIIQNKGHFKQELNTILS